MAYAYPSESLFLTEEKELRKNKVEQFTGLLSYPHRSPHAA